MKKMLIASVVLVVLVVGAYIAISFLSKNVAASIKLASEDYHSANKTLAGFCDDNVFNNIKQSGYTVECSDTDGQIVANLSSERGSFHCQSAAAGMNEEGSVRKVVHCVQKDTDGRAQRNKQVLESNVAYDPAVAVSTLTSEPPICPNEGNDFRAYREGAEAVFYGIMPGVYSRSVANDLSLIAVNSDRSVCSCVRNQDNSVRSFHHGSLGENGKIVWDATRSVTLEVPEQEGISTSIISIEDTTNTFVTFHQRLMNTTRESIRSLAIDTEGCGRWETNLFPRSSIDPTSVCDCSQQL